MNADRSNTVLITGGAGYIGSHVVLALQEAGYRPIVLDNLSTGRKESVPPDVPFIEGDIAERRLIDAALRDHRCAAVMHFAGSIVVPESVARPLAYYDNNVANSLQLLQACEQFKVDIFIFSSTAAVYASEGAGTVTEDDTLVPATPYGRSKLMVEWMLQDTAAASTLRYGILRYFNVAGADPQLRTGLSTPNATHLIKRACQVALGQAPAIDVFGSDYPTPDGTAVRDYIHVTDLAAAHIAVLDHLRRGGDSCTLNCGYGHGFSVAEVLDAVDRVSGHPLVRNMAARRAGDAAALVADPSRLRSLLGWQPQHDDLDHIVETALRWERKLVGAAAGD